MASVPRPRCALALRSAILRWRPGDPGVPRVFFAANTGSFAGRESGRSLFLWVGFSNTPGGILPPADLFYFPSPRAARVGSRKRVPFQVLAALEIPCGLSYVLLIAQDSSDQPSHPLPKEVACAQFLIFWYINLQLSPCV